MLYIFISYTIVFHLPEFHEFEVEKSANHRRYPRLGITISIKRTVLSTSLGKTFFAWRFILNENILFWLIISYQKPFVFPVSVFCSEIFALKLNLRSKVGLTYAISIVK